VGNFIFSTGLAVLHFFVFGNFLVSLQFSLFFILLGLGAKAIVFLNFSFVSTLHAAIMARKTKKQTSKQLEVPTEHLHLSSSSLALDSWIK
jgi:membrane protein implicated in regulation of membrane protease activity